ncbi:MAG: hypothetical protein CME64_18005 [Halobacteriovoraceae bacterium]|nr:hypothetical protein [Halobacteriovoraceae bacterium]|tara:strand:+ start:7790 stop:8083 length:294 start_codon:yes stop_codon:yes gene_type:complete
MREIMNHHETKKLRQMRLRVTKADSSFLYFTFESNEGLAFYSTLNESSDEHHRDILLHTTPEYYTPVLNLLEHLRKKMPIEVLFDKEIEDSATIDFL